MAALCSRELGRRWKTLDPATVQQYKDQYARRWADHLKGDEQAAKRKVIPSTYWQSWARVSKITSRLAPVRLFQTVSRLALSRIFKQKNRVI